MSASSCELRALFAHIMIFCEVSDPVTLWKSYWKHMSKDVSRKISITLNIPNLHVNDSELGELNEEEKKDIETFSSWLLETRDGKIRMPDKTYTSIYSWLQVPDKYCIMNDDNGLSELISFIFDKETLQMTSAVELQQKAIVCSKNEIANVINLKVTSMLHGESKTYVRSDGATPY
ncbi:DNA helicase [Tanacetum coccineum]